MDEKYKFDFLDFHLSAIIGKDGATQTFKADGSQVYVPAQLHAKMQVANIGDPNKAIHEFFFKKRLQNDEDSEEDKEDLINVQQCIVSPEIAIQMPASQKQIQKGPQLTAQSLLQQADAGTNAWSSSSDDEDGDPQAKKQRKRTKAQLLHHQKCFKKAERKQFAQKSRKRDIWDAEYDQGKQRKLRKHTAMGNQGWGKAATTVKTGSMSDRFQNVQSNKQKRPAMPFKSKKKKA